MKISLAFNTFSFFKVCVGLLFLIFALFSPLVAAYSFLIALVVGKAHALGAWLAMWRAGKFNWKYISWVSFLIIALAFWGGKMVSLPVLLFITYMFFAFHFFFDEYDLQEEKMTFNNMFSSLSPFIIASLYLVKDFFSLAISFDMFVALFIILLAVELIYTREISWLFVQTKILGVFILFSILLGIKPAAVSSIFLISHYFFWFLYPVYKLHKYKREERDGLIMILILLVATSIFFASTRTTYGPEVQELSLRAFLIGTLAHILSTPPFGYLFGLPKPKTYFTSV